MSNTEDNSTYNWGMPGSCCGKIQKVLYQDLARRVKLLQTDQFPYYKYVAQPSVFEDQQVANKRPYLILVNKISRQATLIDVTILNNYN